MQIKTYRDEFLHIPEMITIIRDYKNKDEKKIKEFMDELEHLLLKTVEGKGQKYINKINQPKIKPKLIKYSVKSFGYKNYDSKDFMINLTNRKTITLKKGLKLYLEKQK